MTLIVEPLTESCPVVPDSTGHYARWSEHQRAWVCVDCGATVVQR